MTLGQIAGASKPLAPSRFKMLCENILLGAGLWRPKDRAIVREDTPESRYNQKSYRIQVHSPESGQWTDFSRTDRDFFELREFRYYPSSYLTPKSYEGLKVLDLACGDGRLVTELRRNGVEALGLDVHLTPHQRTKNYFLAAGAEKSGLPNQSFDFIFSTQGPLTYLEDEPEYQRKILAEMKRILKVGGRALISPVSQDIVRLLPKGLNVKSRPDQNWLDQPAENTDYREANYWLELVREN